jgi:hypothetical protein
MDAYCIGRSIGCRAIIAASICAMVSLRPCPCLSQGRVLRASRTATAHWEHVPLRNVLQRIRDTYDAAVFLDRRIDPETLISLDLRDAKLFEAASKTAAAAGAAASQIGQLIYVGPQTAAEELRTIAAVRGEDLVQSRSAEGNQLSPKRPLTWPRLTEPRALITSLAVESGLRVRGDELIPHDLWSAGSLPELTPAEQLTVLLAGFDLTFHVEDGGRTLAIVPIDRPILLTRRYRLRYGEDDAARLREKFPVIQSRLEGDWLSVNARLEEHERLAEWLAGPRTRPIAPQPASPTKQVFTLRVQEQPLRAVIGALIQRLNWPVDVDEQALREAGISLDQRVTFEVKDVSQEELLEAMLRPAGLGFVHEGGRLKIVARPR